MTPIKTAAQDVNHALNNVSQAADQLSDLAQQGMDSLRAGSKEMGEQARRASQLTAAYIRNEPIKSVLVAAAIGAAAMALYGLLRKSHD